MVASNHCGQKRIKSTGLIVEPKSVMSFAASTFMWNLKTVKYVDNYPWTLRIWLRTL